MTGMVRHTMIAWAISATLIVTIVLVLRHAVGEKVSRRMRYSLWLVVLIRLLLPFSIGNSALSIQNWLPIETVTSVVQTPGKDGGITGSNQGEIIDTNEPAWSAGEYFENSGQMFNDGGSEVGSNTPQSTQQGSQPGTQSGTQSGIPSGTAIPSLGDQQYTPSQKTEPLPQDPIDVDTPLVFDGDILSVSVVALLLQLWCIGAVAGLLWIFTVNVRFWRQLKQNRRWIKEFQGVSVYETTGLISPCLFGWWNPAIYLTPQVSADENMSYYAMLHENCHRIHRDHLWGMLRGICLAIWWWHPLVWWASAQSRQDCELACDEACVKLLGEEHRQEYGLALIRSLQELSRESGNSYPGAAATLFSGKEELKNRLQALLNRPLVRHSAIVVVILTVVVGVMITFTGYSREEEKPAKDDSYTAEEAETEDVGESETNSGSVGQQNHGLNGKFAISTCTYPWEEQYVMQTTEKGTNVRWELVPIFQDDCKYYVNKISVQNHGINYQTVDRLRFLEIISLMKSKNFVLDFDVVYQNNEITEVYLNSDQQILSLMDDSSLTDPDWPRPYDTWGWENYKTQQTYQADVADVAGVETIEIATMTVNGSQKAILIIKNSSGEFLHAWDIHITQGQLVEILLIENEGVASLMWWQNILGSAGEGYLYWVIRLDENGQPVLMAGARYAFRYALDQLEYAYNPSQLQMLTQPLYARYFQNASLLAGVDGTDTLELYYTFRGLEAYHYTTLQTEVKARQEVYWDAWPASRYVYPDFEEWARVLNYTEEDHQVLLCQATTEYTALVDPACRFYVKTVWDQSTYEEVLAEVFMNYVQDVRNTEVQLRYQGGVIVEMRLHNIYEGLYQSNGLWEGDDGCLYLDSIEADQSYDWSQYTLKTEYMADVSDKEGLERIRIYEGVMPLQPTEPAAVLVVETDDGKQIYLDQMDTLSHLTESYYLGEKDGRAYLVYLGQEDRYTLGGLWYRVIRPGSETNLLSGYSLDWSMEWTEAGHSFSEKSFLKWGEMADDYLAGVQGILRIQYDVHRAEDFEYSWEYDLDWHAYANEIQERDPGSQ